MALRSSPIEICFGPISVFVKLYAVASEKSVSLSQVHATCGGKLEQQYFCATDQAVVPRPAIAKQYRLPDGTVTTLTEEEIKTAESDRVGTLEVFDCVPEGSVDPLYMGKATLVGPNEEHGIDGYGTLVDALAETRTEAVGVHYQRTRDQLVLLQRYGARGLLLRELFHANEMRDIGEVEFPLSVRASQPAGTFELWTDAVERRRRATFRADVHADGYPERLLLVAERKTRPDAVAPANVRTASLVKAARERAIKRAAQDA
jgi:DNA end-binding protein Ku